jgi:intracellular multiplication protein IcmT
MSAHWRNTFKSPRFFIVDARISVFLLVFLMHIRLWTFLILVVTAAIFYIVERRGYAFESAIRALRLKIAGPIRPATGNSVNQGAIDYDRAPKR